MSRTSRKQFWINHICKFNRSGMSQTEYCKANKINPKSFSAQKSQLKNLVGAEEQNFIPLESKKTSKFSLNLSNGIQITFDQAPDPNWVGKMIQSLDLNHDQY